MSIVEKPPYDSFEDAPEDSYQERGDEANICFGAGNVPVAWKSADHVSHIVWADIVKSGDEFPCFTVHRTVLNNAGVADATPIYAGVPTFPGDHVLYYMRLKGVKVPNDNVPASSGDAVKKMPIYFKSGVKAPANNPLDVPEGTPVLYPFKHTKGFHLHWDEVNKMAVLVYWVNEKQSSAYPPIDLCPENRFSGVNERYVDQRVREDSDLQGTTPIVVDPLNIGGCGPEDVQRVLYYAEGVPVLVRLNVLGWLKPYQILIFNRPKRVVVPGRENDEGRNEPILDSTRCCRCCPPDPDTGARSPGQSTEDVITGYNTVLHEYMGRALYSNGETGPEGPRGPSGKEGPAGGTFPEGILTKGTRVNTKAGPDGKNIVVTDAYPKIALVGKGPVYTDYKIVGTDANTGAMKLYDPPVGVPKVPIQPLTTSTVYNTAGVQVPDPSVEQAIEYLGMTGRPIIGNLISVYDPVANVLKTMLDYVSEMHLQTYRPQIPPSGGILGIALCDDCSNEEHPWGVPTATGELKTGIVINKLDGESCCIRKVYSTLLFFDTSVIEDGGGGEVVALSLFATPKTLSPDAGGGRGKVSVYNETRDYLSEGVNVTQISDMFENPVDDTNSLIGETRPPGMFPFGGIPYKSLQVGVPVRLGWVVGKDARDMILRNGLSAFSIRPKRVKQNPALQGYPGEDPEEESMSPEAAMMLYSEPSPFPTQAKYNQESSISCPGPASYDDSADTLCRLDYSGTIGSFYWHVECSEGSLVRVETVAERCMYTFKVTNQATLQKYTNASLCLKVCGIEDRQIDLEENITPTGCRPYKSIHVYGDAVAYPTPIWDITHLTFLGEYPIQDIEEGTTITIPINLSLLTIPGDNQYIRLVVAIGPVNDTDADDGCDCLGTPKCDEHNNTTSASFLIGFEPHDAVYLCNRPHLVFGKDLGDQNLVEWDPTAFRLIVTKVPPKSDQPPVASAIEIDKPDYERFV